jgi:hypothetical protein
MTNSIHKNPVSAILQDGFGGEAPLDLINGHLRTSKEISDSIPLHDSKFIPLEHNSKPCSSWLKRPETEYNDNPLVLKLQRFEAGGYEATIMHVDIEKVGRAMDGGCKTGKREAREQTENDVIRSKQRAKTKIRHLVKSMGCDRLLTLTVRESGDEFWSVEVWAANWKKFVRLCASAGFEISYVSVLEQHKKGNYHMHAATVGKANIKLMRNIWWSICGGNGQGNVDVSFRQDLTPYQRRAGVAKYVTKYITKQDSVVGFNKKRYWASRHELPKVVRYILQSEDIWQAIKEVAGILVLDDMVLSNPRNIFVFPNWFGAWFSFEERFLAPVPF